MFNILILQSLYNLSDDGLEHQILDRYSFSLVLGLHAASKVPDCTTIWSFRNDLADTGLVEMLFSQFDNCLFENGFRAQKWQMIDANIVRVPTQRNSREENPQIKAGI